MKDVMIVSIKDDSFKLIEHKLLYCNPMSYGTKNADYLALYRPKPISAVTHYGKVSKIESNVRYSVYYKEKPYWMKTGTLYIKCYHLQWLRELPLPVVRTGRYNAIIRPMYTNLEKLLSAKTLADLFR
jgi:hypothetical protein